ncbi:MAG: KH domain-containing protein, partial [archaeon]|nr:KH domain-containing protein [archaeon]
GDYIIGEIDYVAISNWKVNIRYPLNAILPVNGIEEFVRKDEDLTKYYKRGDIIFARIDSVTKSMISQLSMKDRKTRKLFGGRIIEMTPLKIPRLIGKEGTMISQIKNKTGCIINVGQNGRVWLKGNNMDIAINTIKMVEKLSHKHGLTNIISDYLDNELKNNKLKKEKP